MAFFTKQDFSLLEELHISNKPSDYMRSLPHGLTFKRKDVSFKIEIKDNSLCGTSVVGGKKRKHKNLQSLVRLLEDLY